MSGVSNEIPYARILAPDDPVADYLIPAGCYLAAARDGNGGVAAVQTHRRSNGALLHGPVQRTLACRRREGR